MSTALRNHAPRQPDVLPLVVIVQDGPAAVARTLEQRRKCRSGTRRCGDAVACCRVMQESLLRARNRWGCVVLHAVHVPGATDAVVAFEAHLRRRPPVLTGAAHAARDRLYGGVFPKLFPQARPTPQAFRAVEPTALCSSPRRHLSGAGDSQRRQIPDAAGSPGAGTQYNTRPVLPSANSNVPPRSRADPQTTPATSPDTPVTARPAYNPKNDRKHPRAGQRP